MIDTNWVDRSGTKYPTCSCRLVNVVVVDVQHNAALAIVTGGVQGERTTSNAHLLVAFCSRRSAPLLAHVPLIIPK